MGDELSCLAKIQNPHNAGFFITKFYVIIFFNFEAKKHE
ncbi:hypothetical protein PCARR_a1265 [Pseudoalteromonas carrageenovora IAM 12662]|uniref:Uncharacterized protein n=1 Tax=Pseudoalteromonas carrageenovora IAM 12662 TaxID=1314868 RepID=A0ABR9EQZ8_PSEVC|nr:hypothetical protein [Pseudoalteromonas carrageenovora IAM 12662]